MAGAERQTIDAALANAKSAIDRQDYAAAGAILRTILSQHPFHERTLHVAGFYFQQRGQNERARSAYRAANLANPASWIAWSNLGVVERRLGRGHIAPILHRRALLAGGPRLAVYRNLANAILESGSPARAYRLSRMAACFAPGSEEAYLGLAESTPVGSEARRIGSLAARLMVIAGSTSILAGSMFKSFGRLAVSLIETGTSGEAFSLAHRLPLLAPGDAETELTLARALLEDGRIEDATRHCQRSFVAGRTGTIPDLRYLRKLEPNSRDFETVTIASDPTFAYPVHAPSLAYADNACLMVENFTVITKDGSIGLDGLTYSTPKPVNYSSNVVLMSRAGHVLAQPPETPDHLAGEAIALGGGSNYFHWLIDWLSKVPQFADNPDLADTPILVAADTPEPFLDLLPLLGLDRGRVRLVAHDTQCERLWLPSMSHSKGGFVAPNHLQYLEDRLFSAIRNRAKPAGRRLFLSRQPNGSRALVNAGDVEELLIRYGFEILDPGDLPIPKQFEIFAEATVILGAHGAGLTNILAAPAGCFVIELRHQETLPPYFRILAQLRGLTYRSITCDRVPNPRLAPRHANMFVPLDTLRAVLETL
ncbi:MAG: DUF563 domain-containing protein [Rhodospirillaceae bacterium]|nr:DUF563 domain-containing protein [Rhodospirillaceae bacterium]